MIKIRIPRDYTILSTNRTHTRAPKKLSNEVREWIDQNMVNYTLDENISRPSLEASDDQIILFMIRFPRLR